MRFSRVEGLGLRAYRFRNALNQKPGRRVQRKMLPDETDKPEGLIVFRGFIGYRVKVWGSGFRVYDLGFRSYRLIGLRGWGL